MRARRRPRLRKREGFWHYHSLSITAFAVLLAWFLLYRNADPKSHAGSFFGNALADWMGLVVTVLATKWFLERGSMESRKAHRDFRFGRIHEMIHEHSLTIFLGA